MKSFFDRLRKLLRRIFLRTGYKEFIRGQGNVFQAQGALLSGVSLDILGDRNRITVGEGCKLYNLKFHIRGSDHRIEIGPNCWVTRGGVFWIEDDHGELHIGPQTSMVEISVAVTEPYSKIVIGEGCMFANDIDIRTGDSHSILENESGKRINFAADVTIGDRVWVAAHAIILKGVNIGADSVVAAGAVVTKSCEPGSILAGNPAKVIKAGISWKRERIARE
jgi:acetyltransferase-like isoleucine patch superfamily enzyme